jgi:hypothetical protein
MGKYLFDRPGDDTSLGINTVMFKSFHCECFSRASLAISKNSCVVPLKHTMHLGSSTRFINFSLGAFGTIYSIKRKLVVTLHGWITWDILLATPLWCLSSQVFYNRDWLVGLRYLSNRNKIWLACSIIMRKFPRKGRSHTDQDFEIAVCGRDWVYSLVCS